MVFVVLVINDCSNLSKVKSTKGNKKQQQQQQIPSMNTKNLQQATVGTKQKTRIMEGFKKQLCKKSEGEVVVGVWRTCSGLEADRWNNAK